jgi:hypothetical protein
LLSCAAAGDAANAAVSAIITMRFMLFSPLFRSVDRRRVVAVFSVLFLQAEQAKQT